MGIPRRKQPPARRKVGGGTYEGIAKPPVYGEGLGYAKGKQKKRGPYTDNYTVRFPKVARKPITAAAEKVLIGYHMKRAFWYACRTKEMIEWAGKHILGVGRSQAYETYNAIADSGGPLGWFQVEVLDGMDSGKIGRGRATVPSPRADAFFFHLSGNSPAITEASQAFDSGIKDGLVDIHAIRQSMSRDDEFEVHVAREVVDYFCCRLGLLGG